MVINLRSPALSAIVASFVLMYILMPEARAQLQTERSLYPGDNAPSLRGGVWLKGTPIHTFKPGEVYILDFGGVLCGPCRAFIPHLTNLASRYAGQVTVVGVYVYENGLNREDTVSTLYQDNVRRFVARMGDQIRYKVVVDGPALPLARTWMEAGGYTGLPTTFIVNKEGRMVWAGYPPDVESVLIEVLAGRFNIAAGEAVGRRRTSLESRIYYLKKRNDYQTALLLIDSAIQVTPVDKSLYYQKFNILLAYDETAAYTFARWVASSPCANSEPVLFDMAHEIMSQSSTLKKTDTGLVLDLTDKALKLSRSDVVSAFILDVRAQAFFLQGKFSQALQTGQKALEALGAEHYPVMEEFRGYMNSRLTSYKQQQSGH